MWTCESWPTGPSADPPENDERGSGNHPRGGGYRGGRRHRLLATAPRPPAIPQPPPSGEAHPAAVHRTGHLKAGFEAAVRLAKAENATIMPAFLARVPRSLPLDSPLPGQCGDGMTLLEAIEQQASGQGIPVDARVSRGRTYQDALRRLLQEEDFDRVIVSATNSPRQGLTSSDLEWLLEDVPAEVMILRPAPEDTRRISTAAVSGHF